MDVGGLFLDGGSSGRRTVREDVFMRKTAVVTGASSGIGAATARRLAAEGFNVVLAARRRDRLDKLVAEIEAADPQGRNAAATAITLDVTSQESVDALAAAVRECHLLVNNAGGALGLEPVAEADPADWQAMYDSNVLGLLRVTRALLPKLIAGGDGHIINITSLAGHAGLQGGGGFASPKNRSARLV